MSSYEQRVQPFIRRCQYLLFAVEPYTIRTIYDHNLQGPSSETDFRVFTLKVYFKVKPVEANKPQTAPAANGAAAPCSTTSTSSTTRVVSPPRVPTKHQLQLLALDRHLLLWETVLGLCLLVAAHHLHPAA
ncbi:hypothetical protein SLEP1_g53313 [Rubroshorea leprosula]|uniref:Uncharacterized protein n=1 Tax=Rubroshorea leprosula TaxID=152421 RepID=A0AAV5M930_9ROSI|nr:hypothetical protein SLEP1_g53313 [Rubroshorea leprosula]